MNIFLFFLLPIFSYLFGSIQSGTLIGKIFYKVDVRDLGSKSPGATNIHRTIGLKPGIIVLILDIIKGLAPILFIMLYFEENLYNILSCIFLVLGHCYPIYHKFKGGKGVATGFGSVIVIVPYIFIGLLLAIPLIYKTRFVSLGAILGCLISILLILFMIIYNILTLEYFLLLVVPLLIIYKHKTNISRLIHKEENKLF
tara:strand:- start:303 stop:899 length:597 start_codon:yes stop_codon:yes gene_type:complete